jgi:hypothetical protein
MEPHSRNGVDLLVAAGELEDFRRTFAPGRAGSLGVLRLDLASMFTIRRIDALLMKSPEWKALEDLFRTVLS